MNSLTLVEKIIYDHSGLSQDEIYPGNVVWVTLDMVTARDYAGPQVINLFEKYYPNSDVFNNKKILLTPDCYPYGNDPIHARDQQLLRDFSLKHNVELTDLGQGIGSHILIKRRYIHSGDIVIGADSHYNLLGAMNVLGLGAGDIMLAFAFKTGKFWLQIPETIKVNLTGKIIWPTTAKDVALFVLKELHQFGITGNTVEFYGEILDNFSLEEKITLCSMITEASGFIGFIPEEDKNGLTADKSAKYKNELTINISNIGQYVSSPPNPHNVVPIEQVIDTPIDSVVIGSCTNGSAYDINQVAKILANKKVKTRLSIIPATREDMLEITKNGSYQTLLEAGANFFGVGCSTCAKGQFGLSGGENHVTLTTGNRNTKGKIGPAPVFLASPVTAAFTALNGKISVPDREVI
ncbi:MAG: aconitase family protein [Candidatus Thorarchaeota archaeon]